ncbi:acyl-CoA dehydrogenase [Azospirillum sp. INR13]|uniref:acyl-CoA dehydrogenase n=1 Tax=Azospirillum sp. INR13 TaxID=2596919 RepID=UPI001891FCBF|nr:acyl-CoA dehydrogenase [Azospirillum sp. INR13]MBF5096507.1 acyl-CoA dehydrogenase [Azospirillum sp. INR13]
MIAGQELFSGWEPAPEEQTAILAPEQARALAATLGVAMEGWERGRELPPLWQWIYFTPLAPADAVGEDGHPRRGGFFPPVTLPRRMFAGGQSSYLAPLRLGVETRRRAEIIGIQTKSGGSGPLIFVRVRHRFHQEGTLCIEEHQDIVYRDDGGRVAAPVPVELPPPADGTWSRQVVPDPVLLFRFSALTFNGHRIHYDRPYAMEREGYPALVVHGPLIATLLADLVRRHDHRRVTGFTFRAKGPLFDSHPFRLIGAPGEDGCTLAAQGADGTTAMEAFAAFGDPVGDGPTH